MKSLYLIITCWCSRNKNIILQTAFATKSQVKIPSLGTKYSASQLHIWNIISTWCKSKSKDDTHNKHDNYSLHFFSSQMFYIINVSIVQVCLRSRAQIILHGPTFSDIKSQRDKVLIPLKRRSIVVKHLLMWSVRSL